MKFKKLSIHNIASIEDAVIDFEHGPLAEDSRFLICGPTGAGKTTILDCICLALYGTTPRLNIKKVETYVDQFENYRLKDRDDVKIDDSRMLMRRGSLNAYVELIFTDKDEQSLKAVWQCNRVHNKLQGNVKEPDWLLFDAETDTLLEDRKSNVLKDISNRIGLTFDQFCRTTMLAQGDFTKFLKSEEGEKSQILEKLTGTDIYSEISMRIHQLKAEKEVICNRISSKMEGVRLLSEEELESANNQIQSVEKVLARLTTDKNDIDIKTQWKRKLDDLVKQLDEVKAQLIAQNNIEGTSDFKIEKSLLADWESSVEQRDSWLKSHQAEEAISALKKDLAQQREKYSHLCSGLLALKNKLTEKLEIQQKIQTYLSHEAPHENCYSQITLIEMLDSQLKTALQQKSQSHAKLTDLEDRYKKLEVTIGQEKENVKKCENYKSDKAKQIQALSAHIQTLNYADLLKQREDIEKHQSDLKDYRLLLDACKRLSEDYASKSKDLQTVQTNIEKFTAAISTDEQHAQELETHIEQQTQIYDKQVRACSNVMKEYRSMLKSGDICPLCGQKITNLETDQHFASILQPIQEHLDHLQKELKIVYLRLSDNRAKLSVNKENHLQRHRELEVITNQLDESKSKIEKHLLHTSLDTENPYPLIEDSLNALSQQSVEIREKLTEIGKLQENLSLVQKEKENLEQQLRQTEDRVQHILKEQAIVKQQSDAEFQSLKKVQIEIDERTTRLSELIDLEQYKQKGDEYINSLKLGADHYRIAIEKATSVENNIQLITNEISLVEQIKNKIDLQQADWSSIEYVAPHWIDNLSTNWMELQNDVSKVYEALKRQEEEWRTAKNSLFTYLEQPDSLPEGRIRQLAEMATKDIELLRTRHQHIRDQRVKLTAQKESCERYLAIHCQQRPSMDENITLVTLLEASEAKTNEIKEQNLLLGKLTQSIESDKQNRQRYAAIEKELVKATEQYEKWSHLHKLFGSNDGKKFRNIAQSYVLEQLLVNANQYLRQFTTRYEMECQPGSLTILLRDNEAGGVLRPTTTISGGESFLISLSLALGLSGLSRSSLSMDTLFIDEGFGTLDSTYLSSVMDTLERLHQLGGKRIGIISHVESLKERITTQIQVTRVNNTQSKINVVSLI